MDDPYKILGVSNTASQDDIRLAYRNLAKKHHPDLNPGNVASEDRFKSIATANELLSDPIKRGKFDRGEIDAAGQERARQTSYRDFADADPGRRYGPSGFQPGGWSTDDLNDLFGSIFKQDPGSQNETFGNGWDESYVLTVSFLDAANGATKRLTLPDGRVLDVKIPSGTSDGQILRLRNQGTDGGSGGAKGDALIEIHVSPHPLFKRNGQDINLVLPVTLSEIVLGATVDVPTLNGSVHMRIPSNSAVGTKLRLRGRGIPAQNGKESGDLFAVLEVVLGPPDAALEAFLKSWKPEHPIEPRKAMEENS